MDYWANGLTILLTVERARCLGLRASFQQGREGREGGLGVGDMKRCEGVCVPVGCP